MRVVCFDLDDTLVSERSYVLSGLRAVGRYLDGVLDLTPGTAPDWLVERWTRDRTGDVFQRFLADHGSPRQVEPGKLLSIYRSHRPTLELRRGARELFATLESRGEGLALISDGHEVTQRAKWAVVQPPQAFRPVIFTDARGREFWKPNPWAFREVMAAWPDAAQFVYVADNAEKDFVAPNQLGWLTVQVLDEDNLRPPGEPQGVARPALQVRGLAELARLT